MQQVSSPTQPTLSSCKILPLALGCVAAIAALVTIAALVVLFVPPVAAAVGLSAWILYTAAGVGLAVAIAAGLGALLLGCKGDVPQTPVSTTPSVIPLQRPLKERFAEGEMCLPIQVNKHVYYILDPNQYAKCQDFNESAQAHVIQVAAFDRQGPAKALKSKMEQENISMIVSAGGNRLNASGIQSFCQIDLFDPNRAIEMCKPYAKSYQGKLLIAGTGYTQIVLFAVVMECLQNQEAPTQDFVKNAFQAIETALGLQPTELASGVRKFFTEGEFLAFFQKA